MRRELFPRACGSPSRRLVALLTGCALAGSALAQCEPIPNLYPSGPTSDWQLTRLASRVELLIVEQADFVAELAEQYAALHGGEYPMSVADLWSIWPDPERLVNPFQCEAPVPIDGGAASAGQIGYISVVDADNKVVQASIQAFGSRYRLATFVVPAAQK